MGKKTVALIVLLCIGLLALCVFQDPENTAKAETSKVQFEEEKELKEYLPFDWENFLSKRTDELSLMVYKTCDKLSRDDLDEMGQIIYFSKEFCDNKYEDYELAVFIYDENGESQITWISGLTELDEYGCLTDKRSGESVMTIMYTLDDLCAFFPALRREINESMMDKDDIQIYTEVMEELNTRMNETEEEIYIDLAPKYGMTDQQLSIFIKDVMEKVYSKNKDISIKTPIAYPAYTESKSFGYFQEAPDVIYTTPASENGKEGEIYSIIGEVIEYGSFLVDGYDAYFFIINAEKGPVLFYDIYGLSISMYNDDEELRKYFYEPLSDYTFPNIGDYVKVYGVYQGYSGKYDMPSFWYGIPSHIG